MLWMDYYFYLSKLPEEERRNQILLLIGFFIVLFIIGGIGEFIRHKFNKSLQNLQNARKCGIINIMAIAMLKPL